MPSIQAVVLALIGLVLVGFSSGRDLNQVSTTVMPSEFEELDVKSLNDLERSANSETRLVVTFKSTSSSSADEGGASLMRINALAQVSATANVKGLQRLSDEGGVLRIDLENPDQVDETIASLQQNELVESVEIDQRVTIDDFIPNDTFFGSLWGIEKINAPSAWDSVTGSKAVVVCVIDTGVDYTHEDLKANMWRNPGEIGLDATGRDKATNGIDDDGNGVVDDVYGLNAINNSGDPMDDNAHGTHCAGTIGAVGNNALGVVGVAHEVSIMACKFLDASGSGWTSDAIQCLDYALKMGATLTSNSWGGGGSSSAMSTLINLAQTKGQLFVAAAGNSNSNNDLSPHFPSNYPQDIVVSVASTTSSDGKSSFSSYGKTTVDLGAPGSSIASTIPGNGYAYFSGTSMATPHVAGALSLMYAYNPDLSAADAKRILMETGTSIAGMSETVSGKRLDVAAAIAAMEPGSPEPTTGPTTAPTTIPTTEPTTVPTTAPTTEPTTVPTTAPTPEPSCQDDPDYLFKGREGRDCEWVAEKKNRRCRNGANVIGCPATCGVCDACQDDPNYLFKGRENRDCAWVARKKPERCSKGLNIMGCPVTCGLCA